MGRDTYLFWVYDGNLFLGGGITRHKKDGERELRIRRVNHPKAVIYWEDKKFTDEIAREIAFVVAKTVQRIQPGIRESVLPSTAEIGRQIGKAIGLELPSAQDNVRRHLGNELTEQIIEAGTIEQLPVNTPELLEEGKK